MEHCDKHGPYSVFCGSCDRDIIAKAEGRYIDFENDLRHTDRPIVFCYSSYWGKWSRLLKNVYAPTPYCPQAGWIELDLEPVNGWGHTEEGDTRIRDMNIRCHGTARHPPRFKDGAGDYETHELPDHVLNALISNVGGPQANFMLSHDFLADIDWEAYRHHNNGGTSFYKCKRSVLPDNYLEQCAEEEEYYGQFPGMNYDED